MIAAEWKSCKLGDVVTLQRGFDLPKNKRKEGNVPIVSSSGVSGYHDTAKVAAPGVVTGRYGTLGEVFHVKKEFWPLNTTLYVRDFKGNDPLFISYFLRTLNLAHQNAAGAVPGLNRNALHLLPARVPPPSIQRKIASVLSAYDDLIENNTRRIEILEEMAQMIYREWFVDFRFPGHEKVGMVESELGLIPSGWAIRKLEHVCVKLASGGTPARKQPDYWGGHISWFKTKELNDGFLFRSEELECISKPCWRQTGREQGRADLSKYSPILGVFRSAQAPGVAVLKCALSDGRGVKEIFGQTLPSGYSAYGYICCTDRGTVGHPV